MISFQNKLGNTSGADFVVTHRTSAITHVPIDTLPQPDEQPEAHVYGHGVDSV